MPAIRPILAEHGEDGPIESADVVGRYLRHLLDVHVVRVALDGERIVGFGAAADAGVATMLTDLFVSRARLDGLHRGGAVAMDAGWATRVLLPRTTGDRGRRGIGSRRAWDRARRPAFTLSDRPVPGVERIRPRPPRLGVVPGGRHRLGTCARAADQAAPAAYDRGSW